MAKRDTTIFYQNQIDICKKYLNAEQFGRLMFALFEFGQGEDPEVGEDIALAFAFMSLQQKLDREKYDKIVARNRENGKKGGRPKKDKNPNNPNGFFKNPNDNDNEDKNVDVNEDGNEEIHDSVFYGTFENVELTGKEYYALKTTYERTTELINKVSIWLRTHDAEDHYALCVKFAENDQWPKRKVIEPVELYEPVDPLSEDEQAEAVAQMKAKVGGLFKA